MCRDVITQIPGSTGDNCAVVELRQYTTYPGQRDTLIEMFEREFLESQEATGIHVIAEARDLSDPNRFVWLRGFADMAARLRALTAFYSGPVWKAHRDAANATMYDSDNVLLLRPASERTAFSLAGAQRAAPGTAPNTTDLLVATTYHVAPADTAAFIRWFDDELAPRFTAAGATILAELVSEHSENTFPRLPVRLGENVFVWLARFADRASYDRYLARLAADAQWRGELFAALHKRALRYPEVMLLEPAPRSLLGHASAP